MNKRYKWALSFVTLIICICVFSVASFAWNDEEDFEDGDFTCRYIDRGTRYGISIVKYNGTSAKVVIPETIDDYVVEFIGEGAFQDCDFLESVDLPSTLVKIDKYAFYNCSSLKIVGIPEGVEVIGNYAFERCISLESMELPKGLEWLGSMAFANCTRLRSINIPAQANISRIDLHGPFYGCENLTDVTFDEGITSINSFLFEGCSGLSNVEIPNTVEYIREWAFRNCKGLRSITLPDSLKTIEKYAFLNCTNLKTVSIPDSVTTIGPGAFCQSGLESFDWPENVTTIESYMFELCPLLENINIPETTVVIGSGAFNGCPSLKEVELPDSITEIGSNAFSNCTAVESITIPHSVVKLDNEAFEDCSVLKEIVIPESITEFGYSIFKGCTSLEKVTFPNNLISVPSEMFWGCSSLNNVIIPDSCTSIQPRAFMDCTKLDSITLPDSIQEIGYYAFSNTAFHSFNIPAHCTELYGTFLNCSHLETVNLNEGLKIIGREAFRNCPNLRRIILPDGLERIGVFAFAYNENLEAITIPSSVTDIEYYAFGEKSGETDIGKCENVTIYGYSESYAIEFAYAHSIRFCLLDNYNHSFHITYQPYSACISSGRFVQLVCMAEGVDISYQWQVLSSDNRWENVIPDPEFANITGREFVMAILLDQTKDGNRYRCVVTDKFEDKQLISDVAEVTITDDDFEYYFIDGEASVYYVGNGSEATIPAEKKGYPVTVIPVEAFGGTDVSSIHIPETVTKIVPGAFYNCNSLHEIVFLGDAPEIIIPEGMEGDGNPLMIFDDSSNKTEINIYYPAENNSWTDEYKGSFVSPYTYECRFINWIPISPVEIISQTGSLSKKNQETAEFHVEATGGYLKYQWQQFNKNEWINCKEPSATTDTLSVMTSRENNGNKYRCIITDAFGNHKISEEASLMVEESGDSLATEMGHNLNLSGSIGVNYFLHLSDEVLADEGAKVHFDLPNGLTSEVMVKDAKVQIVKDVECREFGCKLHSSQMTGTIKAKVILSDGTESEEFPYTVKEYADLIIENPDNNASFTKVTPLIKAMLNYGGYAQAYFKYDDNPLANKDLTTEERNAIQTVTAEDVKDFERVVTGSQEGLIYEGSNLMLTSETCIRHFFTVQSGHDISEYTFKMDGKTLTPVKSGKMYYVEISNIASGNLDTTYTVTAGGITIHYSALSYVYTQLSKEDLDPALANTLRALYLYNQEANLYFKK